MSTATETELLKLRDITARSGVLHPAQTLQLKMWGALLSPRKGSFEVEVDPEEHIVVYRFARLPSRFHKKHPAGLQRSVQWLFGAEWAVRVFSGDKSVFSGRRQPKQIKDYVSVFDQDGAIVQVAKNLNEFKEVPWRDRLRLSP